MSILDWFRPGKEVPVAMINKVRSICYAAGDEDKDTTVILYGNSKTGKRSFTFEIHDAYAKARLPNLYRAYVKGWSDREVTSWIVTGDIDRLVKNTGAELL